MTGVRVRVGGDGDVVSVTFVLNQEQFVVQFVELLV